MKIGFIGIGNIASSVIKGLCSSKFKNLHINISPRNKEKSTLLSQQFNEVSRMDNNQQVIDHSQVVFCALPPTKTLEVLQNLTFNEEHILVSLVPFVDYEQLVEICAPMRKICRAVPFPTVERNECPILIYKPSKEVLEIMEYIGTPIQIEQEEHLQVLWTLTGLIAPFYDLNQKLSNWAQSFEVEKSLADSYIIGLFSALTCYTRSNSAFDFLELKNEATTPNGMNHQALSIINQRKANEAYLIAAEEIYQRFKKK
jgi:pyrroline-5-carboxylate reductase